MTQKPPTPAGAPRPAAAAAAPPASAQARESVGYLGLTHFLRAKQHVAAAADVIAQASSRPDPQPVMESLERFAKVTPDLSGGQLVDYFIALVERELAQRNTPPDPLAIYMLHAALMRRENGPRPQR